MATAASSRVIVANVAALALASAATPATPNHGSQVRPPGPRPRSKAQRAQDEGCGREHD